MRINFDPGKLDEIEHLIVVGEFGNVKIILSVLKNKL